MSDGAALRTIFRSVSPDNVVKPLVTTVGVMSLPNNSTSRVSDSGALRTCFPPLLSPEFIVKPLVIPSDVISLPNTQDHNLKQFSAQAHTFDKTVERVSGIFMGSVMSLVVV